MFPRDFSMCCRPFHVQRRGCHTEFRIILGRSIVGNHLIPKIAAGPVDVAWIQQHEKGVFGHIVKKGVQLGINDGHQALKACKNPFASHPVDQFPGL